MLLSKIVPDAILIPYFVNTISLMCFKIRIKRTQHLQLILKQLLTLEVWTLLHFNWNDPSLYVLFVKLLCIMMLTYCQFYRLVFQYLLPIFMWFCHKTLHQKSLVFIYETLNPKSAVFQALTYYFIIRDWKKPVRSNWRWCKHNKIYQKKIQDTSTIDCISPSA